jgi:hypothetical protein
MAIETNELIEIRLRLCVEVGIRWLFYYFSEWPDMTDVETLDMTKKETHILAQIFDGTGGHPRAREVLISEEGEHPNLGQAQGFCGENSYEDELLTKIWIEEINKRNPGSLYG